MEHLKDTGINKANLERFVFIAPGKSSDGFILLTKSPYYLGRITKLQPGDFFIYNYVNEFKPLVYAPVHGYSIIISFAGTLDKYSVRVNSQNWEADLKKLYEEMALWLLEEKIHNNQNYYKRFKL